MKLSVSINNAQIGAAKEKSVRQAQFAVMKGMNKSAAHGLAAVKREMLSAFDRPTPWVMNSIKVKQARDRAKPVVELAFKDAWSSSAGEVGGKTMVEPHVHGGARSYKGMEVRLMRMGMLPSGWSVVPGAAAQLDGFGNMNRGQISQLLNVLGTYTESGYNKANAATRDRLKRGNAKKGKYGFVYWVNRVNDPKGKHLQPGVYQRVSTAFGSSLKPVLIFVQSAAYRRRLDFYRIAQESIERTFPAEFATAFDEAMRTAFPGQQGRLL